MKRHGSALVYVLVTVAAASALLLAGLAGMQVASRQRQAQDDAAAAVAAAQAGMAIALDTTGAGAVEYGTRTGTGALLPITHGSAAGSCSGFTVTGTGNPQCDTVQVTLRNMVKFSTATTPGPAYMTTKDFVSGVARTLTFYAADGVSRGVGRYELVAESGFTVSAAAGTGYTVAPVASGAIITVTAGVGAVSVPVTVTYSPLIPSHTRAFRVQMEAAYTTALGWVTVPNVSTTAVGVTPSGATVQLLQHRYTADRPTPSSAAPATAVITTRVAPRFSINPETGRCTGVAGTSLTGPDDCPYGD